MEMQTKQSTQTKSTQFPDARLHQFAGPINSLSPPVHWIYQFREPIQRANSENQFTYQFTESTNSVNPFTDSLEQFTRKRQHKRVTVANRWEAEGIFRTKFNSLHLFIWLEPITAIGERERERERESESRSSRSQESRSLPKSLLS